MVFDDYYDCIDDYLQKEAKKQGLNFVYTFEFQCIVIMLKADRNQY